MRVRAAVSCCQPALRITVRGCMLSLIPGTAVSAGPGEATHAVTSAGDYTVFVRDNAGNYTQVTLTVSYAQRSQQNSGGSGAGSSSAGNNTYMSAGSESIYYGVPAAPIAGNSTNVNTNRVNSEKETKETEKTEDRETESKKETESKESEALKTPLMSDGTSSGFPIRWILIIIAAVAIIIGVVVASKLISDRQAAAGQWDDDDEPDMSKVYARVSANESQTLKKAAAAASASAVIASKVEDEAKEEAPVPETVSKAAPEVVDEPTVRVAAPEIAAAGGQFQRQRRKKWMSRQSGRQRLRLRRPRQFQRPYRKLWMKRKCRGLLRNRLFWKERTAV